MTVSAFEPKNADDRTVDLKVSANVSRLNFRVKNACDAKYSGAYIFSDSTKAWKNISNAASEQWGVQTWPSMDDDGKN